MRILKAFAQLKHTPRRPAASSLAGHPGLLHVRTGDYRIAYRNENLRLPVLGVTIGHRQEVFRNLP